MSETTEGPKHSCGFFGVYSFSGKPVSIRIYNGLMAIQHRGQDSAGITTLSDGKLLTKKAPGLVSDVFSEQDLESLTGSLGIGHVRYPTTGYSVEEDAQPFVVSSPRNGLAIAHNGNIANLGPISKILKEKGRNPTSSCDVEYILHWVAEELIASRGDIWKAIERTMNALDGSYSVVMLTGEGELIAFRDPLGIKPMCMAADADRVIFASESTALDINNMEITRDVKPGEAIVVSKKGIQCKMVAKPKNRKAHCMFEYVYFARPDSIIDRRSVYDARYRLGQILAQKAPAKADLVVPVPDTSRPAACGYSDQSKIPLAEGLIKNRYIGRTFIMPDQGKRDLAVRLKLNPLKTVLFDKNVVLIDDSIVRGTTLRPIVSLLKEAGAKEVHVRITCPPVISPCFYGVNIPTYEELAAHKHSVEEIRKNSGADSLAYMDIEGLLRSIGMPKSRLCLGCITDHYPTPVGNALAKKIRNSKACKTIRCWEMVD